MMIVSLSVLILATALSGEAFGREVWGETVGPVSAIVETGDSRRGLTIRSRPYAGSPAVGHFAVGSRIKGYNQFRNGWMRVQGPYERGWVPIDNLRPKGGKGFVESVDSPEGCLRIRSGPSLSRRKIGCARMGRKLRLTGVWSENNWAEISNPVRGWVYAPQVRTALKPHGTSETRVVRERRYIDIPDTVYTRPRYPYRNAYPYPNRGRYYGPRYPYSPYRYGPGGYGVRTSPRGGVSVQAGPVGVGVGPRGGVGVRVGGVGVGVGPGGAVRVRVGR